MPTVKWFLGAAALVQVVRQHHLRAATTLGAALLVKLTAALMVPASLLAAVLLDNPPAFTVVWVHMVSISLVSALILATFYRRYERAMLSLVASMTTSDRNLALFMATILVVPIVLMLV